MTTPRSGPQGSQLPQIRTLDRRLLTSAEFSRLKDVPPEAEWFANTESPGTRRIYRVDLRDFTRFAGLKAPAELRLVTRAYVIAYRDELLRRGLQGATIRRKLAGLSSAIRGPLRPEHGGHEPRQGGCPAEGRFL